ncbi:MAG: class I SAM-dependent methyltransferase [Candidatus Krumholzibacteria bacterium]|nr:class I SAM-dependent methyltransferase [Candidatus Krumholzibacteria bacterium]
MPDYYREKLSADRLERVYAIAPPRVLQYLNAEIDHVLARVRPSDAVLELGCGYGRVLGPLARRARIVCGIDTSFESLAHGSVALGRAGNCAFAQMDAVRLGFRDGAFDRVVCIQNGISAFHVDARALVRESVRVTRPGGLALFSSYSEAFWEHRLEWFVRQAGEGLVGAIDWERTRDGTIVCADGFTATTMGAREFAALAEELDAGARIVEIDSSSVFCEITAGAPAKKGRTP